MTVKPKDGELIYERNKTPSSRDSISKHQQVKFCADKLFSSCIWFTGKCFDIDLQVNGGGVVPSPKLLGV